MIESLYEENFAQGKLEKSLKLQITPLCNEESVSKEETQRNFHRKVTLPVFQLLARAYPTTRSPFLAPLEDVAKRQYGVES